MKPTTITLPSDFSAIRIGNLKSPCTATGVVKLLADVGMTISEDAVQITKSSSSNTHIAVIKVADPTFSRNTCRKLRTCVNIEELEISSIPAPKAYGLNAHHVNCRKVECSWTRPTRTAILYFTKEEIAVGVHERLGTGTYKVNGSKVRTTQLRPLKLPLRNSWAFVITLLDETVTEEDITKDFKFEDSPSSVFLQPPSYELDVDLQSTMIHSMLSEIGPLDSWNVIDNPASREITAQATFSEDSHAQDAASLLNQKPLPFHPSGKLSVQQQISVSFKLSCRVYDVVQNELKSKVSAWQSNHVFFSVRAIDMLHRMLHLRGSSRHHVAKAQQELEYVVRGQMVRTGTLTASLSDSKSNNRTIEAGLRKVEKDFGVALVGDATTSQVRVWGCQEMLPQVTDAVCSVFRKAALAVHLISLDAEGDFEWAISGGFQAVESQLGRDKAFFSRESKSIIVCGTKKDFTETKATMSQRLLRPLVQNACCPICLCVPEEPVHTICSHIFCRSCFGEMCLAAVRQSSAVKCEGSASRCGKIISLQFIHDSAPPETFEQILAISFRSHVSSRPQEFRYCPTPDCDFVYRVAPDHIATPAPFLCERCLTSICTACHIAHPRARCDEYRGDHFKTLGSIKRRMESLGIKDCSRCGTAIEKDGGCNHVACYTCRANICWTCEATFDTSDACYSHMLDLHGCIGQ